MAPRPAAPVKEVAQIGAALGREFSYHAAVACRTEEGLRGALDQLVDASLVFRRGVPPHASFVFKHALVQDAAYSTLLRGQRQELHARIAQLDRTTIPRSSWSRGSRKSWRITTRRPDWPTKPYPILRGGDAGPRSIRHGRSGIPQLTKALVLHIGAAGEHGTRRGSSMSADRTRSSLDDHQGLCGAGDRSRRTLRARRLCEVSR